MSRSKHTTLALLCAANALFAPDGIAQWVYDSTGSVDLAYLSEFSVFIALVLGATWCLARVFYPPS